MLRIRTVLIPPVAAWCAAELALRADAALWARHATPAELSDDAAHALLGWTLDAVAAVALVALQTLVMLPVLRRVAVRWRAGAAIALAVSLTALAGLLMYRRGLDSWLGTVAAASLAVGIPTLVQGAATTHLLRTEPPVP